ncbi:ABC transporter substrate-binding protein [Schinkia azotoformans]|uniref:Ferric ion ABC transporter ferric ion-binding protein n=1 Tax=Schinkia azotoformans LMG 9581 TaxID=1131731 RepID=K6DH40_SCHAZ|nr:ABC transporter substrate-binding protein [Schinkia azotoformans]EKN67413.1 ferric ion ABC transporter ferric ion-binding protein [Schinkia azotoformans LMG 9581]MEC1639336.1 ABC transporter substrate-binding protein [Schinkia azotoformans]MEC1719701.1 ABC transporter substrate-binding protein [Schinkia azotoformans]MEC1944410.1 ABC transporter substrate-binding protein [Schinkia azotoformans]MED4352706.1 ABC transporter substrate-binding protein [Schinkia azotoformans]
MRKLNRSLIAMSFVLLFLVSLIGCSGANTKEQAAPESKAGIEQGNGFPVTLTDATGTKITIENKPTRIVSLMPSNTEIAFALGAGDEVVGVTDWDNYPKEVLEIEKVGGLDFNVEKVLALEPDLVLANASGMSNEEGYKQLQSVGVPVVVVPDATSFDGVYDSIALIGKAVGADQKATEIISTMKEKLEKIKEKASTISDEEKKTVWVEVQPQPDLYTTGKDTFMDDMLTLINAKNAAGDYEGWVQFTEEDAISLNPDVIVVTYGFYVENPAEMVYSRPAWKDVPAVKKNRVFEVDADKTNRSGPRLIEGVEELASVIYPEVFNK